ncbi:MAG TPA: tRNA (adenosine(37)-N6)-threonylcarbamoyltransferase complex ATPase subunit type 1 TsaE [Thermohalobaculum sp.]|nr:tRNA (adenosine(37)-N6)-threonylcarbamoyltransferase complex ATPase subunit type 1 TsaE [Thermohalobaculum sp.]
MRPPPDPRTPAASAPLRRHRAATHPASRALHLADPGATARLGTALAPCLGPGDSVLLAGPLGAGKSALARAVIAARIGDPDAEVPSPSYTLVNVYATPRGPVWHADLYRLAGAADELEELGLAEAMAGGAALVLVEWPERLGAALPDRRLELALSAPAGGGRDAVVTLHGPGWQRLAALLEGWR